MISNLFKSLRLTIAYAIVSLNDLKRFDIIMNYYFIFLTFLLSSYRGRKVFNIDFTFT